VLSPPFGYAVNAR